MESRDPTEVETVITVQLSLNSNLKKLLGFRNMQEKLEKLFFERMNKSGENLDKAFFPSFSKSYSDFIQVSSG